MSANRLHGDDSALTRRRRWKWVAGVATAVLVAGLGAIASGLGAKAVDRLTAGDSQLLSYGTEEQGWECGSTTYLPNPKAETTRQGRPPADWTAFQHQPGAVFASSDVVQISIQGASARKVTLTGIRFSVKRQQRPNGATFSSPCGGPVTGRGLQVDVEANPPLITASSESTKGYVTAGGLPGSDTPPIAFPWSVSLTDPLLLYVIATADSCYCVWSAEIPWVSGGEKGTIRIDNEGHGYTVVGIDGLAGYTVGEGGWQQFRQVGESAPG